MNSIKKQFKNAGYMVLVLLNIIVYCMNITVFPIIFGICAINNIESPYRLESFIFFGFTSLLLVSFFCVISIFIGTLQYEIHAKLLGYIKKGE